MITNLGNLTRLEVASILGRMSERDPDGWEHKNPTMDDYRRWEQWVTDTYGAEWLDHYRTTNWLEIPEV